MNSSEAVSARYPRNSVPPIHILRDLTLVEYNAVFKRLRKRRVHREQFPPVTSRECIPRGRVNKAATLCSGSSGHWNDQVSVCRQSQRTAARDTGISFPMVLFFTNLAIPSFPSTPIFLLYLSLSLIKVTSLMLIGQEKK